MTLDEQLQRALETFTSRLNEEVTHQVRALGDELAAAARAEQVAAEQAAAARAEQVAAELAATARTDQVAAELAAARADADKVAAELAAAREDTEKVAAELTAVRADKIAAELAAARADQVAAELAAAREDRDKVAAELAAVRADKIAAELAAARADQVAAELAAAREDRDKVAAELVAVRADHAAAERAPATGRLADGIRAMSDAHSLSEVLDTLVSYAGHEAARAGVLLVRGERFHGWRFLGFDPSFESGDPLDIARPYAGVIAQAAGSAAVALPGPNEGEGAPVFARLPPGWDCVAVPILIGGQVVAILYADAGQKPGTSNLEPGTLNPESLEILTRFASQRLEALTAIKAARSLVVTSVKADASAPAPGGSDDPADEHAAARRYARLLVSEIKLYHESQVAEGRRERDLATRLGGEIARVRTLYEKRVPLEVRQTTDYVHEELIRTLADGDASLLEAKT